MRPLSTRHDRVCTRPGRLSTAEGPAGTAFSTVDNASHVRRPIAVWTYLVAFDLCHRLEHFETKLLGNVQPRRLPFQPTSNKPSQARTELERVSRMLIGEKLLCFDICVSG